MPKYRTTFLLVLGTALCVPGLRSQDNAASLERSLAETKRAIEVLAGIQRGLEARHPAAIELVKQATEPVSGEARVRDNRLVTLRDEVNRLQAMSDRMQGASTQAREVESTLNASPARNEESAPRVLVTTGLTQEAREELVGLSTPVARGTRSTTPVEESGSAPSTPKDAGAAAADPLRQAQVLYRAARYEECAYLLRRLEDQAEPAWWRARALERLGRDGEALECYRHATQIAPKDSTLQKRATQDLEFLEWKIDFNKKLAGDKQPAAGQDTGAKKP
ncbi:MAG: tetratricopeptide repeat protein [Planctomycetes bacterium]|nr:tetratricopeptide repeat protein [Planctomycetota bacterium]